MPGIVAVPDEADARFFHVVSHLCFFLNNCSELINPLLSRQEMTGPAESPFEGGKFKLELFLPELKVKIM